MRWPACPTSWRDFAPVTATGSNSFRSSNPQPENQGYSSRCEGPDEPLVRSGRSQGLPPGWEASLQSTGGKNILPPLNWRHLVKRGQTPSARTSSLSLPAARTLTDFRKGPPCPAFRAAQCPTPGDASAGWHPWTGDETRARGTSCPWVPAFTGIRAGQDRSPPAGDCAYISARLIRRRWTLEGMFRLSRYLATVRRAISMPKPVRISTIWSSDSTSSGLSSSTSCLIR